MTKQDSQDPNGRSNNDDTYTAVDPKQRAVALKYKPEEGRVPQVVASGRGLMAEQILQLAEENQIYVHHNPELATFLAELSVGEEIPENLYVAIAEVLAFAYRLKSEEGEEVPALTPRTHS